jgi:cytolysin-activating lysine-acyltransferase
MIERYVKNYHGNNEFWLLQWVQQAIVYDQIHIFFTEDDTPIGFIAWAFLAPDVQQRLVENPSTLLHPSEWTEGTSPWIIDCVALPGFYKNIFTLTAQTVFKEHSQINYVRRRLNSQKVMLRSIKNKFYKENSYESV